MTKLLIGGGVAIVISIITGSIIGIIMGAIKLCIT